MSQTVKTHKLAVTAILSAAAAINRYTYSPMPFLIPSFVKMDFSELPALLAAFSLGPVSGVAVCLVKNVINVFFSTTGGVGELCNFLLGVCLVVPAGLIYRARRTRGGALAGALLGSAAMAGVQRPHQLLHLLPLLHLVHAPGHHHRHVPGPHSLGGWPAGLPGDLQRPLHPSSRACWTPFWLS